MQENDKKIIIRVMNIIALLGNIGTLFLINALNFLAKNVEEFSEISRNFENAKVSILQQSIILGLCIIFSIKISLIMAISMMIGSLYNIIAGFVSIIIIYKKKKGEIEENKIKLEDVKSLNRWIYLILFIAIFIIFYTSIVVNLLSNVNNMILAIGIYLGRIIFVIIPFFNILKRDIKEFICNKKLYLYEIIKTFAITILFYIPVALIINLITGSEATNQNLIKEIPLWITAILAVIIAPISEEILFRGFIRKIFKNDWVYIAISGIIFGVIHCMYAEENWLMYLFVLPYAVMGVGFARLYAKTNNIIANIALHFIWNLFVLGTMVILSI